MIAPPSTAPFLAATALLGAAGAAKMARPGDTATALRYAGLPATRGRVRAGAALELVLAIAAVALPGLATGLAVAASYAAFTAFVVVAARKGWPIASCGCFGRPGTPPMPAHAVLDGAAALASFWWAADHPTSVAATFTGSPPYAAALGLLTAAIAVLAYVAFTDPLGAARRAGGRE